MKVSKKNQVKKVLKKNGELYGVGELSHYDLQVVYGYDAGVYYFSVYRLDGDVNIETYRKNVFLCPMRCVGQIVECNLLDTKDVTDYKFDNLGMKPIHKVNGKKT